MNNRLSACQITMATNQLTHNASQFRPDQTTALLAAPGLAPALGASVSDPCTGGDPTGKLNSRPAANGRFLLTKTRLRNGGTSRKLNNQLLRLCLKYDLSPPPCRVLTEGETKRGSGRSGAQPGIWHAKHADISTVMWTSSGEFKFTVTRHIKWRIRPPTSRRWRWAFAIVCHLWSEPSSTATSVRPSRKSAGTAIWFKTKCQHVALATGKG